MNKKQIITIVKPSRHFDEEYYLKHNQDAGDSHSSALEHYCKVGIHEDRKPNELFDPIWYREHYEDVKADGAPPLVHYILFGEKENRFMNATEKKEYEEELAKGFDIEFYKNSYDDLKAIESEPESLEYSEDEKTVLESTLFNTNFYLNSYPDVKLSKQDPLKHFCNYGWKEDRNPNEEFNTRYYKEKYPDIANAGVNPFLHWIKYGKNEHRFINAIEVEGEQESPINTPSIIFISHEASQTGAPAVLLSLMQWIKENTKINFSIIVGASGPWNHKFEKIAPTFFMDAYHHHKLDKELKLFCGNHVQAVYINTIASALYANHLSYLQAEFITHVHEMENVFKIFQPHVEALKKICTKYIAVSQGSIDAIERHFDKEKIELTFLKPFIDKKRIFQAQEIKPTQKKAIFGCGAVEMRKGFDIFCSVASLLKSRGRDDFHFYWIGSELNTDLDANETIAQHGVEDVVEYMGTKEYPRDFFAWGEIFLLPSREDPYPLVCMEAAESDMPVICFDAQAGGMHSFVEEDAGGVIPYLDNNAMADAVAMFLDNEQKRVLFGKNAHQKVIDRHYVDVIAPKVLSFLPESIHISDTTEIESYRRHIEKAEAVSFDIFDTLVTRKLHDPNVVFDVIEYKHTQNEAAPLPLFHERMQTAGRTLASHKGKVDDITIDEIYENMSFYQNSEIEKKIEIDMCVEHPIGKKLFAYAKSLGKRIYITSDMYLDIETVKSILQKNGIEGWDQFYLSSHVGMKKDTGKLFEHLKDDAKLHSINAKDILHIGDNWRGDIEYARKADIRALRFAPLYEREHKLFEIDEASQKLSQIGKIWNSFSTQATRLWIESEAEMKHDFYTRLGFELTGPLASMMAIHTRALADKSGASKIIFMARDGRIMKKAFDTLYASEIEQKRYTSEYLHLSRSTVIPATFEHPLSSNDLYFLIEGIHLNQKSISYFIQKSNLQPDSENVTVVARKYFDSLDTIPTMDDMSKITQMFKELSSDIYEINAPNREALEKYLSSYDILTEESLIFVDVGWMLNIQSRLDRFIESIGSKAKVIGSYVGSRDRINKSISHESLLFDGGDPYLFSNFLEENVTLFEVLFSAPEASASSIKLTQTGVEVEYKPLHKPIPTEEFIVAQKLHLGAEAYFERLKEARDEFFPEQISKDYFFELFKSLVYTKLDIAKATLGHFEVLLGGHHEFVTHQQLVKYDSFFEYKLKRDNELFSPLEYIAEDATMHITIVTSAGVENGSTRYRARHLADSLRHKNISATLIHAATPLSEASPIIAKSNSIVFQRCFEEQGNVGQFFQFAKESGVRTIAESDDKVFPEFVPSIGSVKGGEWHINEAMFVAESYEKLIKKVDACIVSTPALKNYIEESYDIPTHIVRNKITQKRLQAPNEKLSQQIKLLYSSGTYSHKEDFDMVEKHLYDFMLTHKDIKLSILGAAQVSERLLALENVSNYPLMSYTNMLQFISKHDLMLVPLVDDVFNRAKSNIKFVECGAVGVPVLASKVAEFDYAIEDGENGLLASTPLEFKNKLKQIVESPEMLKELAKNAHMTIKQNYTTAQIESGVIEEIVGY